MFEGNVPFKRKRVLVKREKIKEVETAMKGLVKAMEQGGEKGHDHQYIKQNPEIVKIIQFHAEKGNGWSQFWLGFFYIHGWGKKLDMDEGIRWLKKSAAKGLIEAYSWVGMAYDGIRDRKNAAKYYLIGAKKGCPKCMAEIARYYFSGTGVKKNDAKGNEWFLKAAQNGNYEAQRELGNDYYFGRGCEKDVKKALHWLELAAENGDMYAADLLGMIYRYGEGEEIPQDLFACARYYEIAWKKGNETSLNSFIEVNRVIYAGREAEG